MESEKPWHLEPLRIAALQCNFEKDSMAVLDVWRENAFNTEQLLHLFGEGYYGAFREDKHGSILDGYLEKAHGYGIRVIVYANTHTLPHSMPEKNEEWGARNSDGSLKKAYETHLLSCPNSPWADWVFEELRRLAKHDIDGVFSDGPAGACSCSNCKEAFRRKYGYPWPVDVDDGGREASDMRAFDIDTRVRFMKRFCETLKAVRPEAICYQNLDVFGYSAEPFLPYNDLVGSEGGFMFYGPPSKAYLWKTSLRAKALASCARGKPTVIFAAGDQKSWSCYLHAPAETKLMYAASIANGASVWYGLHCSSENMRRPGGLAAGEFNRFHADHEYCYADTESAANVAILNSMATRAHYRTTSEASDFYSAKGSGKAVGPGDIASSTEGFAAMLYRTQIPFDFISEETLAEGTPARYKCIVLPTCACLSEKLLERLRTFVQEGGLLIASLDTSLFDEKGTRRGDFGLADVFGAGINEDVLVFHDFNYFEFAEGAPAPFNGFQVRLAQAPAIGLNVKATTAEVVGVYHAPLPGRYEPMTPLASPAVLWNSFGKGRCLYLAGTFGEFYSDYACLEYEQMVANAIRCHAAPPVRVMNAPPSLEITLRRKRDGSAVVCHLINYTGGMVRPIQESVSLLNLELRFRADLFETPPARFRSLGEAKDLNACAADGEFVVTAPGLFEYDVILVPRD